MKIMLCSAPDSAGDGVLKVAVDYASCLGAALHAATCLVGGLEEDRKEIENAKKQLKAIESAASEAGVPCESRLLVEGISPGETLVRHARDGGMDLIVIGIEKTSKVEKLVFGSTAQFVILKAPCPVLTVNVAEQS